MEKSCEHHLIQVMEVNIDTNKIHWEQSLLIWALRSMQPGPLMFLPKMHDLNLIVRKINGLWSSKWIGQQKQRLGKCSPLKETEKCDPQMQSVCLAWILYSSFGDLWQMLEMACVDKENCTKINCTVVL